MTKQAAPLPPAPSRKTTVITVLHILGNIVFYLLLIIMAVLLFFFFQSRFSGSVPKIFGYEAYIVYGGSMSPAFEAGSLIIVEPVDPSEVKVGDVITFESGSDTYTTHRVMKVHGSSDSLRFTTRGDANEINDRVPVMAASLRGRVIRTIPYLGCFFHFVRSGKGLLFLIIIPGLVIIIWGMINISRISTKKKMYREEEQKKRHPEK
jgi:signal peptidase